MDGTNTEAPTDAIVCVDCIGNVTKKTPNPGNLLSDYCRCETCRCDREMIKCILQVERWASATANYITHSQTFLPVSVSILQLILVTE